MGGGELGRYDAVKLGFSRIQNKFYDSIVDLGRGDNMRIHDVSTTNRNS